MWLSIWTSNTAPAEGPAHVTAMVTPAASLVCVALPDRCAELKPLEDAPTAVAALLATGGADVAAEGAELHAPANAAIDTRRSPEYMFLMRR
jgi:hypothetical protein